jgi:uncharacterized protein
MRKFTTNFYFYKLLLLLVFFAAKSTAQFTIPEIPKFQTSVYDYANLLSVTEKSDLEKKLIQYSDSTSTQIVVIIIESLKGEDIGILTPKWGHEWGIGGSAKNDNGVIVLLAKNERKIWISPGYGVESKLTAGTIGEITRKIIIPEFKSGNYYQGLNLGTNAIFEVLKGTYKGSRVKDTQEDFPIFILILIIIIAILIFANRNNNSGNGNSFGGSPSILDAIILSNLGRSGGFGSSGSFGSSGGGGFGGGFGGGGFSGGGAGGDW